MKIQLVVILLMSFLHSSRCFVSRAYQPALFGKRWPLRWFSSVQPGEIEVFNEQTALKNINQEEIKHTISKIRSLLGYETYAVSLVLVDDDDMQETNKETRGVDAPTDVLSFPMHDAVEPGVLEKPEFDIPDYYNLGDMMIDVPYVIRQCKDDEEWEYEDEDDRGVSAAMVNVFDPEKRIHMLLVHGMLHLVGYDHIDDADYELMVTKEDELLKALNLPLAIKKEN